MKTTNKIYPKEWLEFHPYSRATSADLYYTGIANRIYEILQNNKLADLHQEDDVRTISCCVAAYFEDQISGVGIWRAFTSECRKLYNKPLPFYQVVEDDYFEDEVNYADICFLLWHCIQSSQDGTVIDPENEDIAFVAKEISNLLDDEFEAAPINEKMQNLFSPETDYSDFFEYRRLLEWFHYDCYLNLPNGTELDTVLENMSNNPDISDEHLETLEYTACVELCFMSRSNLLAMSSPEWLARIIGEKHPQYTNFRDVERKDYSWYLFRNDDARFIYVTDLVKDLGTVICIEKRSLDRLSLVPDVACMSCVLVKYGEAWWQCGMCISCKRSSLTDKELTSYNKDEETKNELLDYTNFIQATGGRPVMYFSSANELTGFFTTKMNYLSVPDFELPANYEDKILLSASKEDGLQVMTQGIECIKDPLNPFYDAALAKKTGINFFVSPGYCPFDVLSYLVDNDYLPDAALNSHLGEERGRKLLHDNWDFIARYFLRQYDETGSH